MGVWYRPDQFHTLDVGSSRYLSWADSELYIARMLADSALYIARMLASDAWVSLLKKYYGDRLLPKVI